MFQIVLIPGAEPLEFTHARAKRYKQAVVSEMDDKGKFVRVIAADEYMQWDEAPKPKNSRVLEKPVLKEAVSAKKPAPKKKKANKQKKTAIPDDDSSLENIDVSSI